MAEDVKNSPLQELLARWCDALQQRQSITAEQLCEGNPEKINELKRLMLAVLLRRWQQSLDAGQPIDVKELCRYCPEHLHVVQRRIEALEAEQKRVSLSSIDLVVRETAKLPDEFVFIVSRFRDFTEVGMGGLAQVFRACDDDFGRKVALKFIRADLAGDPERRSRFLVEVNEMANLEHPGVVPVYGMGQTTDGRPFFVMRYMDRTLDAEIEAFYDGLAKSNNTAERRRAFRRLLQRFISVCETIAYAHSKGILHCDVKPDNVLLGHHGETMLADWGKLIRINTDESPDSSMGFSGKQSYSGLPHGTPVYMSPEQAVGRPDLLTKSTDIYCLGATLYHVLTGRPPISGEGLDHLIAQVLSGEFPPPSKVNPLTSPALEAICLKAMSLKPKDRYATADELADDVEAWLAFEPISVYRDSWTVRFARWARGSSTWSRLALATFSVLMMLIFVLALLFAYFRN